MKYYPITQLKELPNNPRTIKDASFKSLVKSITENPEYFEARPLILSNRKGDLVIIAGNQRFKAAKEIGLKKVPCFLIENLTEEKEKEIIIRDNVSNGDWDYEILKSDWDIDQLEDWGVEVQDQDIFNEKPKKSTKEIKPYIKCHILISFPPDKFTEIQDILNELEKFEYLEIEQASN